MITPPALGNVPQPYDFVAQSCQGLVALSWSPAPLATTYYVSSSLDAITWTVIAQTPLTSYQDASGTVDVPTYYYVQAATTLASSQPSNAVLGMSLLPGQTTLGNLVLECRQRTNKENSTFYTDQEMNSMVSQSYKSFYDKLVTAYGDDYFVQVPFTWTTGKNQQLYPLPTDFYKQLLVEVALNPQDPNSYITLRMFNLINKNLWNYPNQYTMYGVSNLRWRINGNNLMIVPQTQGNQTIRMWYVPRPSQLINATDLVDGVSGWEEYIVCDVCVKMLGKEESSTQLFLTQLVAMDERLDEMASNRSLGEPQTVSDSKSRNFSWSSGEDGGGWSGSGGGGG